MPMRVLAFVLLASLALVLAPGVARAGPAQESTVTASATAFVRIHAFTGSLRVVGWNRPEVKVTSDAAAPVVSTTDGGARVTIEVLPTGSAALEVRVPAGAHVEARAVQAAISVHDVTGAIQVSTVEGAIEVAGGSSDVEASTVSGRVDITLGHADVRATSVGGDVSVRCAGGGTVFARTVSGAVSIAGAPLTRVEGRTVSGGITLDTTPQGSGPFVLRTHSGEIRASIPKKAPVSIDTHTFSGRVEPDGADTGGAGAIVVSLSTFSGDIHVARP